jgi:parallel beta-helix repeat protein
MAVFHVAKSGNDDNDGLSEATAFRTLEAAQMAMRASAGADETQVHAGVYRQTGLLLTDEDDGSAFVAAAGEAVTLSGGRAVSGWVEGADGVWTAQVDQAELNQLTLNGARLTEARYPNEVPTDPVRGGWLWAAEPDAGLDPLTQIVVRPEDRGGAAIAPGAEVHVFAAAGWANAVLTVASYDAATGVVTFTEAAPYDLSAASRYFVQGTGVQLDQPGEWYFEAATRTVHFKAPPGFDGKGVVASGDGSVIDITGGQDIRIEGFTITDAATGASSTDFHTAGILVRGGQDVTITGNEFVNLAKGVRLDSGSRDVTIDGNDFAHIWAAAVDLDYGSDDNRITGNSIRQAGEVLIAGGAINMYEGHGNVIAGNLIRDVPRNGISGANFDPANPSGGNIIEFNTIIHSNQATSDTGAINFWSNPDKVHDGEIIRWNRIIDAGGVETAEGRFLPGFEYSNGIYLDDFTSRATVVGNFVQGAVRGGIYLHGGNDNTVTGNITIDNRDIGIQLFEIGVPMTGNVITGNIVGMTGAGGNAVEANPAFVAPGTLATNWYLTANGMPAFNFGSFAAWQALGFDAGSLLVAGSPFVDAAAGDYRVTGLAGFTDLPWAQMTAFRGGLIVAGSRGADALAGSAGADLMVGLEGNDVFIGGAGADEIEGGAGRDTVTYAGALAGVVARLAGVGSDGDVLTGIEDLTGSDHADRLVGDGAANVLRGGGGADTLEGGAGADRLFGGRGADVLKGGAGGDVFVFRPGESGTGALADRVTGFQTGLDRIDLTGLGDLTLVPAFGGTAGEMRIRQEGAVTWIEVDRDGNGAADFALRVTGAVAAGDLLIL